MPRVEVRESSGWTQGAAWFTMVIGEEGRYRRHGNGRRDVLTTRDLERIGELVDEKLDQKLKSVEDWLTEGIASGQQQTRDALAAMRIENEKAHAAIGERIAEMDERLSTRLGSLEEKTGSMAEDLASMAEDVAKISVIEGEIRSINQNIEALRDHAGI